MKLRRIQSAAFVPVLLVTFAACAPALAMPRWLGERPVDAEIVARVHAAELEALAKRAEMESRQPGLDKVGIPGVPAGQLVGTWLATVDAGLPTEFRALHTFHADRTFTETSDLLATLAEGPAHGAWWGWESSFFLTFQLFAFEGGTPVGLVRVRCLIDIDGPAHLSAFYAVDFIDNDGVELLDLATGTFTAVEMPVLYVAP